MGGMSAEPVPASPMGRLAARAEQQLGLLTSRDLADAGIGPRQITRWIEVGRLVPAARGVFRIGGCPPSTEARVLASILVHGTGTWASHRTAAWLWGLEGFGRPGLIEVTRLAETSNQRSSAAVHRSTRLPDHHQARVGAVPVTSLSRTLFDLAGQLGPKPLGRAIEAGLRTRSCTIGSLFRVTEELGGRGRRGTVAMRAALEARGRSYVPTESELDVLGRAVLASIRGIEWQVPMSDARGYIRRVDRLHPAAGLVIEWDGAEYHGSPEQQELDAAGDERLRALGLHVVRFTWGDVTLRPGDVRTEVGSAVAVGRSAA